MGYDTANQGLQFKYSIDGYTFGKMEDNLSSLYNKVDLRQLELLYLG